MASKSILITGCSAGGIGASIASSLATRGHHVFVTARDVSKIPSDLASLANVTTIMLDITSQKSVTEAVKLVSQSGHQLDVLVNNAGSGYAMPILDIDLEKAKNLYEVNLWGQIRMVQGFADQLITSRGRVVNISTCAVPMHTPWISTYVSSKAALTSFSETLRLELAPFQVDVVTIMTGTVESLFHANDPFTLPPQSRYSPIEGKIADWASGELKPKGTPTGKFAEMIVSDIVGPGKSGLVWKGPNAGSLAAMSKWVPQSLCDAAMSYNQGLKELSEIHQQQTE